MRVMIQEVVNLPGDIQSHTNTRFHVLHLSIDVIFIQ